VRAGGELFVVLAEQKLVRHPGDVVADHQMARHLLRGMLLRFGQRAALLKIKGEEFGEAGDGARGILGNERMVVDVREKKAFELGVLRAGFFAESRQALREIADFFRAAGAGLLHKRFGVGDQIADKMIDHVAQGFIEFQAHAGAGMRRFDLCVKLREERNFFPKRIQIEQLGFERVIEIGGVVSNFVHPVNELRFERRAQPEQIFGQLRMRGGRIIPRMFHDAFADFKGQIQSVEADVTMLEVLHDAKGVQIVIEAAAVGAHQFVELSFAGVSEGRMPDVVHQSQRLDEFRVDAKGRGHGAGNLRDLQRVGQPVAKMIGKAGAEDLGFCLEPSKRAGMDDAVAVARILAAIGVGGFRKTPPARGCGVECPGSVSAKRFDCRNLRVSSGPVEDQD